MNKLADDQGYIKSWRKLMDNELLMSDNTAFILFIKLLHLVNRKKGWYTTGRFALAERVNLNPSTAYKALKRLEANGLVTLDSNSKRTIIHICNWVKYQEGDNKQSSSMVAAREQHGSSTVTLNKKEKENNKKAFKTLEELEQFHKDRAKLFS